MQAAEPTLIIACGALARELKIVLAASRFTHLSLMCLPASLHNRPERIPAAVRDAVQRARATHRRVICLYGDCGTGGELDRVLAQEGVERISGAHCYDMLAGVPAMAALMNEEPGTFFLTDYLVRHFDRLVISGLGLDRHPALRDMYFGHYRRVVYLSQIGSADLLARAEACARQLGLAFCHRATGLDRLRSEVEALAG
jgi:hypothetical protein